MYMTYNALFEDGILKELSQLYIIPSMFKTSFFKLEGCIITRVSYDHHTYSKKSIFYLHALTLTIHHQAS